MATAADDKLEELRRACAEIIGADPDLWPDHGNAPLAIAASLALRSNALQRLNALSQAVQDVMAERQRQDQKWGGAEHDDGHSIAKWVELIRDYAGWARVMAGMNSPYKARRRLIQVAAIAVAAVEAMDRESALHEEAARANAAHASGLPEQPKGVE